MEYDTPGGEYAEHRMAPERPHCPSCLTPRRCTNGVALCSYDDGNGLWMDLKETPSDLGFSRKYSPQDYALPAGLSSEADQARSRRSSVEGGAVLSDGRVAGEQAKLFNEMTRQTIQRYIAAMSQDELLELLGHIILQQRKRQ